MALFATPAIGHADEEPERQVASSSNYEFSPIAVTPSPYGEYYHGRFLFINKTPSPVMVSGFDKPVDGKFAPRFVRYQILEDGKWKEIQLGYCGTGAQSFAMKPGNSYEFHDTLSYYPEQDTPLTGRIGFTAPAGDDDGWIEYWSQPFVLDWKKDRESGEFATARKEYYKKLRAVFSKAGFKEELLVGDDFCSRLVLSMMKPASVSEKSTGFRPFSGKLEGTPVLELDGKIRMDFSGEEKRDYTSVYSGTFILDPRKFSPRWFREAAGHHVEVGKYGDGLAMTLDDGTWWDSPLYLNIKYTPLKNGKVPSAGESKALITAMLNVLADALKE